MIMKKAPFPIKTSSSVRVINCHAYVATNFI